MEASAELLSQTKRQSGLSLSNVGARIAVRHRLVVVGNGMASYKFCERLIALKGTTHYEVLVFGEEPRPAYDRVHLTDFLGGRSADELSLGSLEWYAANGITLRTGCRVVSIDREARGISTDRGESFSYDKLVLAMGSRPFVPRMQGTDLSNVFVYRTVDDVFAIREAAKTARTAAVIGGGLLGLEAASALQRLGVKCHILEYAAHLLCTQLDSRAGELARHKIESLGIDVHLNARVHRIEQRGERRVVHFVDTDQDALIADLVVIAAGVRPRHDLGEACGLTIAIPGGILVNDRLETSDPNVYAIGECASHRGTTCGLVAPAYRMAEVLAENLLGRPRSFSGGDISTRLKVLGLDVAVLGDYNQSGDVSSWESSGSYRRIVLRGGRLVGASAFGEWPEAGEIQDAVLGERRVWAWQVRRFCKKGVLWPPRKRNVIEWPVGSTVCNCMNVSCGTLVRAKQNGCDTVKALAEATGASTLCGSCKPLLAELVGASMTGLTEAGGKGLGIAVLAALILTAILFGAPAIPYAVSVQSFPYDTLWRDAVWKQVTGFTLSGLSLLGLLLSARKRVEKFNRGSFGLWRAFHGIVGAGGLAVLVAHTGLRFGSHLNFALMIVFVLANLAGAMAGGIVSSPGWRSRPPGMATQRWLIWGHIALASLLPVLVGFHVVAAYYF
jgi:nitrite reductase (NADH) large subunit